MTSRGWIVLIIVIILIALGLWFWTSGTPANAPGTTGTATTTVATSTAPASSSLNYDQTVANGPVSLHIPSANFGLAINETQLSGMTHSYIPPCDQGFDYCLYDIATSSYQGTNFESAGIAVTHRTDLATEAKCMTAPPAGYSAAVAPAATSSGDTYSASVFAGVGNAAAGHFSSDTLYRLYSTSDSSCWEFDTRIGQTDFGNYPAGAVQQFTSADQAAVQDELNDVLEHVALNGEQNLFAGVMSAAASASASAQ